MPSHGNSQRYNHKNNHHRPNNGASASAPQQVMVNPGNFAPNPMQMQPQFQAGILNNLQLPMLNTNNGFAAPFFPFSPVPFQNPNANSLPHVFAHNAVNMPQYLPHGQLNLPNFAHNVNQLLQMQMPNCGPQNPGLFMNAQFGLNNTNGIIPNHNATGISNFVPPQAPQNQNVYSPDTAKSQSISGVFNGTDDRKSSWKNSHNNKNFNGGHKHNASQGGFRNRQFNNNKNTRGNNRHRGEGNKDNEITNFSNSSEQIQVPKKRSVILNYSEQEIQQWREARRRNYPSKANIEKSLKENLVQSEAMQATAKIRREELKEIVAKQIELGCEVAEIPRSYFLDSEVQKDGMQQNKTFGKRGKFQNKFGKRQRAESNDSTNLQNRNGRFTRMKQNGRSDNQHANNRREPSLLKKLLSSDIKKDKKQLLQVFRFMVMNSFFESGPEKTLKFPVVIVKEMDNESEAIEQEEKQEKQVL